MGFNQLTDAQAERLALLAEELGEAQQAVGKILRHGYSGTHPDGGPTNKKALESELGDVKAAISLMTQSGDLLAESIHYSMFSKLQRVFRYMHHQPQEQGQ